MLGAETSEPTVRYLTALPTAAYVHIPFCRRRCYYCDFPISVVGDRRNGSNSGTISQYVDRLCEEICLTENFGQPLTTVFFGGGTPSLLTVPQLQQILQTLDQQFGITSAAEISLEIDPGTFDLAQVQGYKATGVNRLSLGVQAFQPQLLAACGRSHTVADIDHAVNLIHQADIPNYSLDLISGLPQQTLNDWEDSLHQAIALAPTHVSCYDLTVEAGTPFSRQYQPGIAPLPDDETTASMYRLAQQILTGAGYDHYEISNYAKPGYQCQHNRVYWENRPFYGFGMGATSYLRGDRHSRPRKTREYYDWLIQRQMEGWKDETDPEVALAEVFLDTLMLGLRLAEGLDIEGLRARFGNESISRVWDCLFPYRQQGWVEVVWPTGAIAQGITTLPETGRIRLTDPEGFLFSNVILVDLFEALG